MSNEKNRIEALRWFETAEEDIEAAEIMQANNKHSHCCFLCQQASEKAIKAIYYNLDEDPWGHSIVKLIEGLKDVDPNISDLLKTHERDARILDRYYIPTRYPNGLPDIIPSQAYGAEDAVQSLDIAKRMLSKVRDLIK